MFVEGPVATSPRRLWRAVSAGLISTGGLLGAAGVAVSAAASHVGGGSLGQTAGTFLLLHAAAVLALAALVRSLDRPTVLAVAGAMLAVGVTLFSADLVASGFWAWRPFPPAAPIGGGLLLIGWILVAVGGAFTRNGV